MPACKRRFSANQGQSANNECKNSRIHRIRKAGTALAYIPPLASNSANRAIQPKRSSANERTAIMALITNQTTQQLEITIDTVPSEIKLGEIPLNADRRSTKDKPLTDAERVRRATLPAGHWGELAGTANGAASPALSELLRAAVRELANARLRDHLQEQPLSRRILASDYTVAALLAWNESTAGSRGSITFTREQVEAWYPTSLLFASMAKKGQQYADFIGKRLAALAARQHGLKDEKDALKLITLLEPDTAAAGSDPLCIELVARLQGVSKSLATRQQETISMDDI